MGLNLNPALNAGSRGKLLTNRSDGDGNDGLNPKISILDPSNEAQSLPTNVISKRPVGFSLHVEELNPGESTIEHGAGDITMTIVGGKSQRPKLSNRSIRVAEDIDQPTLLDDHGEPLVTAGVNNEIAIPEYGRDELEEEDDDYGSDEDDSEGPRISQEILDEIYHMLNNINEDRFQEAFKGRMNAIFEDVASLKARFPSETASNDRYQEQFQEINDELDGLRNIIERFRDNIEHKVREMNNEMEEEKEN